MGVGLEYVWEAAVKPPYLLLLSIHRRELDRVLCQILSGTSSGVGTQRDARVERDQASGVALEWMRMRSRGDEDWATQEHRVNVSHCTEAAAPWDPAYTRGATHA